MLFPNYAPNCVFGIGGTLVYVAQNCQLLEHISLWGYPWFLQQKYCYQGTGISDDVLQRSLHSTKSAAWVAIPKHGIIGPYWFGNENQGSNCEYGALSGSTEEDFGLHGGHAEDKTVMNSGSSKLGPPQHIKRLPILAESDFRTRRDKSARNVTLSWHLT